MLRPTVVDRLAQPVAPWSLAILRISFGLLLLWEVFRFITAGWIHAYYVVPSFHFRYFGFEWVTPLPEPGLNLLFAVLGVLCLLIALGVWTRPAAFLFFLGFGYVFLLEQARYLNHFYLVLLLALLLAWVPTDGAWSLAARRRGHVRAAPAWGLLLFRAQMAIVYGYAALAKLNGDWLQGQPLRMWLADRSNLPWIGPLLARPATAWYMSYAGLGLDLLVVPLLLWRRTRGAMFLATISFHLANALLFDIGIFPWLAIAATTVFFAPDWPVRLRARWRAVHGSMVSAVPTFPTCPNAARVNGSLLLLWFAWQLLVPLRHFVYPGEGSWTEEGHRFSWHMKLRSKSSDATFVVTDPVSGARKLVDPRIELLQWQYQKMADRPDMILQYAHHLAATLGGDQGIEVRAVVDCSLNGRDAQPLIDPDVDLAKVSRSLLPAAWIVPLSEKLRPGATSGRFETEE